MTILPGVLRKAVLPWLLQRDGHGSALGHWRAMEKSQYWSRQALLDDQWQKLTKLLKHAYETVPYYRRVFDERGLTPDSFRSLDDLPKLPPLTRDTIRKYQDDLISTAYARSDLEEFGTGGTTRRRQHFLRDLESPNIKIGAAWRFEGFMGRRPADKLCYVWPVHIDVNPEEPLRSRLKNRYFMRELMFYAGAPTEELLEGFYRTARSFKPDYLKVFPNALYSFSEFLRANNYQLPPVKAIMSTGEIFEPYHRKRFLEVFGAPTFNMYGSREVGNTACECDRRDGLHVAMETSIVEIANDGSPVPDGTEGEFLITDLTNFGSPMIRYAIEDFGCRLSSGCSCGRNLDLISPGVGRLLDRYIAPDGSRQSAIAISASIAEGPPMGQIQFIQKSLTHFHLKLTNDPPVSPEIENHIRKIFRELVGPQVEVTIEPIARLPREDSGKIRYFICEVDEDGLPGNPG